MRSLLEKGESTPLPAVLVCHTLVSAWLCRMGCILAPLITRRAASRQGSTGICPALGCGFRPCPCLWWVAGAKWGSCSSLFPAGLLGSGCSGVSGFPASPEIRSVNLEVPSWKSPGEIAQCISRIAQCTSSNAVLWPEKSHIVQLSPVSGNSYVSSSQRGWVLPPDASSAQVMMELLREMSSCTSATQRESCWCSFARSSEMVTQVQQINGCMITFPAF